MNEENGDKNSRMKTITNTIITTLILIIVQTETSSTLIIKQISKLPTSLFFMPLLLPLLILPYYHQCLLFSVWHSCNHFMTFTSSLSTVFISFSHMILMTIGICCEYHSSSTLFRYQEGAGTLFLICSNYWSNTSNFFVYFSISCLLSYTIHQLINVECH